MKVLISSIAIFFSKMVHSQLVPPVILEEPNIRIPPSQENAVVRGEDAVLGQFPYVAALHYDNQFVCTSSIISPTAILTAAHCIVLNGVLQPASLYYAIANVKRSADSYRIDFDSVTIHPDYNPSNLNNDVAILMTSEPIPLDDDSPANIPLSRICLARSDTGDFEYFNATAMGWGGTNRFLISDPNSLPETLQYAEQKIIPNIICSLTNEEINENKICATGFFSGICLGDSGGPLVHLSADKPPVEIGMVSYVNGKAGCGNLIPAVYTRISKYVDYIKSVAGEDVCTI